MTEEKKEVKEKKEKRGASVLLSKKKEEKPEEKALPLTIDPYDALRFVLMTEKSVRQIEAQNMLVFIVNRKCSKNDIKLAAQNAFNSPVSDVRTMIDQRGRKKAFVKFRQESAAGEIAIRLGII